MSEDKAKHLCESSAESGQDMTRSMVVCLDKFSRTFEASARRWELVVYPSLLAFIVLAAYGFYLIYNLTSDVGRLARSMENVVVSMESVVSKITVVSDDVGNMTKYMASISNNVGTGTGTMQHMAVKMDNINQTMHVMSVPMYQMRTDMNKMSHNIHNVTGPMNVISGILP